MTPHGIYPGERKTDDNTYTVLDTGNYVTETRKLNLAPDSTGKRIHVLRGRSSHNLQTEYPPFHQNNKT